MSISVNRRLVGVVAGMGAAAMIMTGCSNSDSATSAASSVADAASSVATAVSSAVAPADVSVKDSVGKEVVLKGAIAAKYAALTEDQKTKLGAARVHERASGERESGVVYQQFEGGVIVAKNSTAPAFITWGKIRDAWNVERDTDGTPKAGGKTGSESPLGVPTSDETDEGDLKVSTFEHGKITFNTKTGAVEVTVNGKVVPTN